MNGWGRWVRQPQTLWIRRAILQVHLWTGIGLGLYVLVILMWGVSGFHLAFPGPLSAAASWFEALDESNPMRNMGDKVLYWLTYAHFGRFAGRIPGCGVSCGTTLKVVWALAGLAPVVLFATGFVIWWNRATSHDDAR